jgi:hypothetical protein
VVPSSFSTQTTFEFLNKLKNSWTISPCQSKWSGQWWIVSLRSLGWRYISLPISFLYSFCCWFSIATFNAFFSSCKLYLIELHFWWGAPKLLNFKHLVLEYLNRGSRLRRKMLCTIRLIAQQWESQVLGSHVMWTKKCILWHLKHWLELAQS